MRLRDLFAEADFVAALDGGHVSAQEHPAGGLVIYTKACQYERAWNPCTLQCRGLIATLDGEVVARPFPKFFNHGEPEAAHLDLHAPCRVTDKLDGSLGILYPDPDVIRAFADRFWRKSRLVPLAITEQAAAAPAVYTPDDSLPPAWLFDLDGTLAHMDGRGPFDWHRVGEDAYDEVVWDVAYRLADYEDVVFLSGRDESCREQTERWLRAELVRRHGVDEFRQCDWGLELFMRPVGDMRKDSVVKAELFWKHVAPRWRVKGVFDDRDQVVEMWRAMGLKCFQVAPGSF